VAHRTLARRLAVETVLCEPLAPGAPGLPGDADGIRNLAVVETIGAAI